MIDSYMWGKVNRISPEAPVPVVSITKRENRLGGAANVALNVRALGAKAYLAAVVGDDERGKNFFELLAKRNLPSKGIVVSKERPTTVKHRVISDGQHLLRVDEETEQTLSPNLEKEFVQNTLKIIHQNDIDAIIFEDYDKGVITANIIRQVVMIANAEGIPTLVDPKKRNFNNYKNVTLFKPNFKELVEGLKLEIRKNDFDAIQEAAVQLQQKMSIKNVLITLSELGVFISSNGTYSQIPAQIRDISDVSGAGDTVISVTTLCLACKMMPEKIAAIANIAGGLVCEKVGVVPIDKDQLLEESILYFNK
jgi:D-glycero-beta-D-manno-heptose-7-phosphate kinase